MQATVEAAIISGCFGLLGISGTVLVAIAGFRANRRISGESAQAERDRGLWEKRCAAYEEILAILDDRQAFRFELIGRALTTAEPSGTAIEAIAKSMTTDIESVSAIMQRYKDDRHNPETRRARGRLLAYASPEVRKAYIQMMKDEEAMARTVIMQRLRLMTQKVKSSLNVEPSLNEEPPADPEDFEPSFKELCILVLSRDREIIDLIRRELGSDPPSGVEPVELRI